MSRIYGERAVFNFTPFWKIAASPLDNLCYFHLEPFLQTKPIADLKRVLAVVFSSQCPWIKPVSGELCWSQNDSSHHYICHTQLWTPLFGHTQCAIWCLRGTRWAMSESGEGVGHCWEWASGGARSVSLKFHVAVPLTQFIPPPPWRCTGNDIRSLLWILVQCPGIQGPWVPRHKNKEMFNMFVDIWTKIYLSCSSSGHHDDP